MKSRLATPAMALALALTLAACSGGGGDDADGTATSGDAPAGDATVTVWMYPVIADQAASQTFWADTEAAFEEANEGIDLVVELQPWDGRDEKIATAIASGTGPDLVLVTPDMVPQFEQTGGLAPLDGALDDEGAFLAEAVEAGQVDGEQYAVPIYHTVTTAVYNKAAFDAAGVTDLPATWDDVKAAAPALAANGVAVMDYAGDPTVTLNQTFYPLLWQAGGSVFNDDGTAVAFNSDEGREALQFLVDLQGMNGLPADAATKSNAVEGGGLADGTIAMSYAMVEAEAKAMGAAVGEENVVIGAPLTGAEQVTFGLPGLLARTTISEDADAAAAVAGFLASAETQQSLAEASGFFPARTDVEVTGDDPVHAAFQEALEFARPGEINPGSRQVMAALAPHLQAALQGSVSVEEALTAAEDEANALLQ